VAAAVLQGASLAANTGSYNTNSMAPSAANPAAVAARGISSDARRCTLPRSRDDPAVWRGKDANDIEQLKGHATSYLHRLTMTGAKLPHSALGTAIKPMCGWWVHMCEHAAHPALVAGTVHLEEGCAACHAASCNLLLPCTCTSHSSCCRDLAVVRMHVSTVIVQVT
jgi:hypothetical protein